MTVNSQFSNDFIEPNDGINNGSNNNNGKNPQIMDGIDIAHKLRSKLVIILDCDKEILQLCEVVKGDINERNSVSNKSISLD